MEHKIHLSMTLNPSHPLAQQLHNSVDQQIMLMVAHVRKFLNVPDNELILPTGNPTNPVGEEDQKAIKGIIHTPQGVHVVEEANSDA
jgi:hypothetical protein